MAKGTLNRVILIGYVDSQPTVSNTNHTQLVKLTLKTIEPGPKRDSGKRDERIELHHCVLFGMTAEIGFQQLKIGSKVYFEGRVQTQRWQNQSGVNQYSTEVAVNKMRMLDSASSSQLEADPSQTKPSTTSTWSPADFDDIPFETNSSEKSELDKSWDEFLNEPDEEIPFD